LEFGGNCELDKIKAWQPRDTTYANVGIENGLLDSSTLYTIFRGEKRDTASAEQKAILN
jgi:hypothetical protein